MDIYKNNNHFAKNKQNDALANQLNGCNNKDENSSSSLENNFLVNKTLETSSKKYSNSYSNEGCECKNSSSINNQINEDIKSYKFNNDSKKSFNKREILNKDIYNENSNMIVLDDAKMQEEKNNIAKKFNLSSLVVELLFKRGIDSENKIQTFLNPTYSNFYDPFLLKDMDRLVNRINKAIEKNEKVLIFGDYDVDGVSATAILIKYFASINFYVDYFLPNRYVDGYGLTKESIKACFEKYNPNLIITVDCGISCYDEVEYAKTLGIDVIITDHHDIPEIIPNTIVVNAKLPNQKYPFNSLCGTGVAFKIVQALSGIDEAKKYLGICAMATIADIVPLIDENRAIVKLGMKDFEKNLPIGIKMLMKDNKLDCSLTATDIAFKLSPKINAAGRMGDAGVALKLYIKEDKLFLDKTIETLNNLNLERQALCNKVYLDALEKIKHINISNYNAIVLYDKSWDSGILGIVSAKIAGEYHRPTILFQEKDGELKGSARSVNDIDIFSAISSLKEVLEAFGGHKMAAGLTIKAKNFKNFISSINDYLYKHYKPKDFIPFNNYDFEIKSEDITEKFVKDLECFEPCGCGNSKPIFNLILDKSATVNPMPKHLNHINIINKNLSIVAFNCYKYLPLIKNSSLRQVQMELQLSTYKNRNYLKGIAKNISTGILERPKNNDFILGEYLKQVSFLENTSAKVEAYDKNKLDLLIKNAKEQMFGTLFVCSTYEGYDEFLKTSFEANSFQHYIYEVISNSGINAVVLSPVNFENFTQYKNIVFLDPILSKGYLNSLSKIVNAKIFIPNYKRFDKSIFRGLSLDRNVFGNYFKLFSNFSATHASFYNEIDLFKALNNLDKKINFKQFIFCLYVFIELGIFSFESEMESMSLIENKKIVSKLTNSSFYNEVSFILKTIK